jgi:hypothetical protein
MSFIDDPEYLRLRAADMQARAERALYPDTKVGLLRIAGDFDVLARRAEQRLAQLRNLQGPDEAAITLAPDDQISQHEPDMPATAEP